jgi:hypothetical protein
MFWVLMKDPSFQLLLTFIPSKAETTLSAGPGMISSEFSQLS